MKFNSRLQNCNNKSLQILFQVEKAPRKVRQHNNGQEVLGCRTLQGNSPLTSLLISSSKYSNIVCISKLLGAYPTELVPKGFHQDLYENLRPAWLEMKPRGWKGST